jgi:ribonuclease HI
VEEIKQERTISVSIIRILGHMEIEGNEKADTKAKEAATVEKYRTKSTQIALTSTRNATIKTQVKTK